MSLQKRFDDVWKKAEIAVHDRDIVALKALVFYLMRLDKVQKEYDKLPTIEA